MPAAPPRLSMTIGWPRRGVSSFAAARMITSVRLPGAIETIMRIGLAGYCCALAGSANAVVSATAAATWPILDLMVMALPTRLLWSGAASGARRRARNPILGDAGDGFRRRALRHFLGAVGVDVFGGRTRHDAVPPVVEHREGGTVEAIRIELEDAVDDRHHADVA